MPTKIVGSADGNKIFQNCCVGVSLKLRPTLISTRRVGGEALEGFEDDRRQAGEEGEHDDGQRRCARTAPGTADRPAPAAPKRRPRPRSRRRGGSAARDASATPMRDAEHGEQQARGQAFPRRFAARRRGISSSVKTRPRLPMTSDGRGTMKRLIGADADQNFDGDEKQTRPSPSRPQPAAPAALR